MLPDIAWSISVSVGEGFFASNAVAAMIWPDWQYPHCTTSRSSHACWTFLPTDVAPMPSMVVTAWPAAALTGVTHDRRGMPSRDRKSTRLNSSHSQISYAVFCLKKKKINDTYNTHDAA